MAEISAKMVNELRQRTGAPLMECKRALVDAGGDAEKAIDLLRERGAASADKKLANEMKEGLVTGKIAPDGKVGVLLRLGCQTDFVARNESFQKLLADLLELAFSSNVSSPAELAAVKTADGRTVEAVVKDLIATIKENIGVTGLARYTTESGRVEKYVHFNGKVGALVQIDGASTDAVRTLAAEVAMHIAPAVPQAALAVDRTGIDPAILEREKAAAAEGTEGKPPQIIEKIIAGKLEKFFQEVTLVDQPFIKDDTGKKRVRDLVAETAKTAGAPLKIVRFARFKVGEA